MQITLMMRPGDEPMTWDDFRSKTGPFAVALDGYVKDGPRYDPQAPRINFNHHENVERLATRATCAQALIALRLGLFQRFSDLKGPRVDVYVNDCDEDVCTSWFVLNNAYLARKASNPALNRLVGMVDALDTSAGAYPFEPDLPALQELAWMFQPYRTFRASGRIDARNPDDFIGIVTDVEQRMREYVAGRGKRIALDARYTRIGGGAGWSMIREDGENGRMGAFAAGVASYVIHRERPDGKNAYTVGRISQFIPFDVPAVIPALDATEGNSLAHWGCGNTIGGSPRSAGSRLSPDEVVAIVNGVVL